MKNKYHAIKTKIKEVNKETFEEVALSVFRYQQQNNPLYHEFIKLLGVSPELVTKTEQIPFLPIQFFKSHEIKTGKWKSELVFTSSGTTKKNKSKHHIRSCAWYEECALSAFEEQYHSVEDYVFLALLPSYLEREGSSLVYMVKQFIKKSRHSSSGFYLYNTKELMNMLMKCMKKEQKVILIGVSYAMLDYADEYPMTLNKVILMETGGMKGKRKELLKEQIHYKLKEAFRQDSIHSEYGMTELLSQAYSKGKGIFLPCRKMQVLIRETTDPMHILSDNKTGGINVIDLANIDSCSFIATDDLGRSYQNGTFSLHGRFDSGELRGCNLLLGEN
jgi:hypothetical protein